MALAREDVVWAGLRLLDEVGLDNLSLRKLAKELGIQAPTLYWHFKNKQDLLDEMILKAKIIAALDPKRLSLRL